MAGEHNAFKNWHRRSGALGGGAFLALVMMLVLLPSSVPVPGFFETVEDNREHIRGNMKLLLDLLEETDPANGKFGIDCSGCEANLFFELRRDLPRVSTLTLVSSYECPDWVLTESRRQDVYTKKCGHHLLFETEGLVLLEKSGPSF